MVKLFYFSATGNTKVVAEQIRDKFIDNELDVEFIDMENITDVNISEGDLIGFLYPIYGGGTPRLVTEYVSKLELNENNVFIIKTAADFTALNHSASKKLIKNIKSQKGNVFYDRIIVMGSNWLLEYNDDFVKQLYNCSILKAKNAVEEILANKKRLYKDRPIFDLGLEFLHLTESKLGAPAFGISLKADKSCSNCGLCVKKCPVNNIEQCGENLKFHSKCLFCMRCVYQCPQKAIHSKLWGFVILRNGYDIKRVINNPDLQGSYIDSDTKGFFKHFYEYINSIEM